MIRHAAENASLLNVILGADCVSILKYHPPGIVCFCFRMERCAISAPKFCGEKPAQVKLLLLELWTYASIEAKNKKAATVHRLD